MDAVDLDDRVSAQQAAIKSLRFDELRPETFAGLGTRYEQLLSVRGTSEETVVTKRQEYMAVASAALVASREDIARLRAELEALRAQAGSFTVGGTGCRTGRGTRCEPWHHGGGGASGNRSN